jgi:hypothetical protein
LIKFASRLGIALALLGAMPLFAADVRQATQLLDRNYYESAAVMLRGGVAGADAATTAFLLGRAYARSADMYRVLQRSSLATARRYLERLAREGGRDRSRFASLYLGEFQIEAGNVKAGIDALRGFLGQKGIPEQFRHIAEVEIALASGGALPPAAGMDAEARTQLAAALVRTAARRNEALAMMERALDELRKSGTVLPVRAVTNAIGVYTRAGQPEKALVLLGTTDLSRPSHEESPGKVKTLRFYDAALLGNLAQMYQAAGEHLLDQARTGDRLRNAAAYFLAESYLASAQAAKAATLLPALATASDLPQAYRDRAAVMQAAADVAGGRTAAGNSAFAGFATRHAEDPVMLGETLLFCVQVRARCDAPAAAAQKLAATGQGERMRGLHRAVGVFHARAGRNERALLHLETARDKSNKNKIDTNDPQLLIQLADLYLATKGYSENLEIYFELSKEFPAVRQLQEAGQGIYSIEFRSAGDVKIF